ncbi:MAG: hypothetical protein IKQ71_03995 [Lachnospiraceae bacterium]|nr:hypothetical protein [Lachnospiraceae bacterium]
MKKYFLKPFVIIFGVLIFCFMCSTEVFAYTFADNNDTLETAFGIDLNNTIEGEISESVVDFSEDAYYNNHDYDYYRIYVPKKQIIRFQYTGYFYGLHINVYSDKNINIEYSSPVFSTYSSDFYNAGADSGKTNEQYSILDAGTYIVKVYSGNSNFGHYKFCLTNKGIKPTRSVRAYATSGDKNTQIKLSWGQLTNVSGYRVFIYDKGTKKYKKYKDLNSGSLVIKKLKPEKKYKFKVAPYYKSPDGELNLGPKSNVASAYTKPKSLKTPKITKAVKKGIAYYNGRKSRMFDIKWNKVKGATGYYLYSSSDGGKNFYFSGNIIDGTTANMIAVMGQKYQFYVVAYRNKHNLTTLSKKSKKLKFTRPIK